MDVRPYRKFIVALAAAAGVTATVSIDGSISTSDIIEIVLVVLGALGVYQVRNMPPKQIG